MTHTQLSLYRLLSLLSEQCTYDAEQIVKSQEAGIAALDLDLDYLTDILSEIDEITDVFTRSKRLKCH